MLAQRLTEFEGIAAQDTEAVDQLAGMDSLLAAEPDVLIITGDHSTPCPLKAHSWHPVPILMKAPHIRGDGPDRFDEIACRNGEIGTITGKELLPLAMAHAGKLEKFGA